MTNEQMQREANARFAAIVAKTDAALKRAAFLVKWERHAAARKLLANRQYYAR
jgi:hypothetical protein